MPMLGYRVAISGQRLAVYLVLAIVIAGGMQGCGGREAGEEETPGAVLVPVIVGDWWQVAGNPDLGEYTSAEQEPTAFGMWQAVDGTWQLWGCIRKTNVGGNTRLFYRWEGARITDVDWQPVGIAMLADPSVGETPGGLQSPHATRIGGEWILAYGDWEHICFARSPDGKEFARQIGDDGKAGAFDEGLGNSTRDPMITRFNGTYHVYYTANPDGVGGVYARTSSDLRTWSEPVIVSRGGSGGSDWLDAEVPAVLWIEDGQAYYLFRTHSKPGGEEQMMTSVYRSTDPLDFGVDDDSHLVATLDSEATWVVREADDYYVTAVMPDLSGYRVARLQWVRR
ncbi:MAG TPA: hypothetical protein QGG47_14090 [Acidobacteriota bacterium]|nr:hypothetical protein [Acidobacteriota bacterium]